MFKEEISPCQRHALKASVAFHDILFKQAFLFAGLSSLLYLYYLRNWLSMLMCIKVISQE